MKQGAKMDAAIAEAQRSNLTGEQLADLFSRIATMGYFMSTVVGELHRGYLHAEAERKRYEAVTIIRSMATGMSHAKAKSDMEGSKEHWERKDKEIDAEAEYQAMKLKLDSAKGVLQSLQMRLALLRDEAQRTRVAA